VEVERIEHPEGRCLRLALSGELDLYSAPTLDDALVEAEGESWPKLILDLSQLEFMDSAGLRLIVRTHARAEQSGRRLVLVKGTDTVNRVLTVTELDQRLNVVEDTEAALEA